ncbi:MAG: hypothetical protein EZS28_022840 [Streblomastix strix]|uniref:SPRY domain-containing protein n=1 Tax=Streblomastix strix TaxID=222440 RepID=A0A5J4VGZ3_9EUKA|nr:MAG: hypothetical protein EZS28_022840 [Streblomastix strix]
MPKLDREKHLNLCQMTKQPSKSAQGHAQSNILELSDITSLINDLLTGNADIQAQITQKLVAYTVNDVNCRQQINELCLNPLIAILKSANLEQSQTAADSLSILVRNSPQIRDSLIKSGFVEMARFVLNDENALEHVKSNILDVINVLLSSGINAHDMFGLVSVLEKLKQIKDPQKQRITTMANMIHIILTSQGVIGSFSSCSAVEVQNLKIQNQEQKRKITELERKDQDNLRIIEEFKFKVVELENKLGISKPIMKDIPFLITVPQSSYTKKEGEFTFTSTSDYMKTFPICPIISQGIYRCEFKADKVGQNEFFGLMKSGLVIPFGKCASQSPYAQNSMFFLPNGCVNQNWNSTQGNQIMKDGDIIALEVNMNSPRSTFLFINNILQPVYITGIPESVQFFFYQYSQGDSVTLLSLKQLDAPTVNIPKSVEMKWKQNDLIT